MSPTHQDLSNDTTVSQIKSRVPFPLKVESGFLHFYLPDPVKMDSIRISATLDQISVE